MSFTLQAICLVNPCLGNSYNGGPFSPQRLWRWLECIVVHGLIWKLLSICLIDCNGLWWSCWLLSAKPIFWYVSKFEKAKYLQNNQPGCSVWLAASCLLWATRLMKRGTICYQGTDLAEMSHYCKFSHVPSTLSSLRVWRADCCRLMAEEKWTGSPAHLILYSSAENILW